MKKSKLWIVLSLLLVFAAGVVGGVFCERLWISKKPEARRPGNVARYPSHDRWARDLGLTTEQQEKIQEIFKKNEERIKNDERIKTLRGDLDKHFGEIREQLKKEIDAVLTPEQKKKMEAMIQKYSEERRRAGEKREKQNESRRNRNIEKESSNEKEGDHRSSDSGGYRRSHPGVWPV